MDVSTSRVSSTPSNSSFRARYRTRQTVRPRSTFAHPTTRQSGLALKGLFTYIWDQRLQRQHHVRMQLSSLTCTAGWLSVMKESPATQTVTARVKLDAQSSGDITSPDTPPGFQLPCALRLPPRARGRDGGQRHPCTSRSFTKTLPLRTVQRR